MEEEDIVVSEYDVIINPTPNHEFYLLQYLHRPSNRQYGDQGKLASVQIRPLQGKLKLDYELNTEAINYDRSAAENRIKVHSLEGTPVPLNTHYCIGRLDKKALVLTPVRMAVQLRTSFDHADKEFEERRRKVDKEEDISKEIKGKVKMQLKLRMEEETPEARRERALHEQYEKEEWKSLRPHPTSSAESNAMLGSMMYKTLETLQEYHGAKIPSSKEYMAMLTAGTNEAQELPHTAPEAKPFLTELQKRAEGPHTIIGELFKRQQVIPFSFLQEFLTNTKPDDILEILKSVAVHMGRGIFVLTSDRLYGSERNSAELRKARNALLEIFRKLPPLEGIKRDELGKLLPFHRDIVNKVLADIGEKVDEKWRLKFSEEGLNDFDVVIEAEPLAPMEVQNPEPEPMAEPEGEDAPFVKVAERVIEELRREGVMNYMQLLNIAKQEVTPATYPKLDAILQRIINENCETIGNAIILSKAADPSVQQLRDTMIELLKESQVWKKTELKEAVDKKMDTEVSESQFSRMLKELCKSRAKKWYLKCYDF